MKDRKFVVTMSGKFVRKGLLVLLMLVLFLPTSASTHAYRCEFGVFGGLSYYVGDANAHVFQHVSAAYGAQFRYKFTPRWSLKAKAQYTHVGYQWEETLHRAQLAQIDAVAEYNFFRLSLNGIERAARSYSPYVFVGVGAALHGDLKHFGPYLPFGFGLKWQMSSRWSMNIEWQHELFFCDNVEGLEVLDNTMGLNGSNFLKNDLVSTLTVGIGFHFLRVKPICRRCDW